MTWYMRYIAALNRKFVSHSDRTSQLEQLGVLCLSAGRCGDTRETAHQDSGLSRRIGGTRPGLVSIKSGTLVDPTMVRLDSLKYLHIAANVLGEYRVRSRSRPRISKKKSAVRMKNIVLLFECCLSLYPIVDHT